MRFWVAILLLAALEVGLILVSPAPFTTAFAGATAWLAGVYIGIRLGFTERGK